MKLIIEDYSYKAGPVQDIVKGVIDAPKNKNGKVAISYVGYCYNRRINDCIFFLPKVVQQYGKDDTSGISVLGKYSPEDLLDLDVSLKDNTITEEDYKFIYDLSIWIYKTIVEYNRLNPQNTIVNSSNFAREDNTKNLVDNTLLDILLSLDRFNKENQDFFMFVVKNIHSGYNRINWNKTISKKQAYIQGKTPIYLNPINKKKQINFDEELLVIFFSILQYANKTYHLGAKINLNYNLITGGAFENYLQGYGKMRMLQIKYKYFSDKALQLWTLCYSFFEMVERINSSKEESDYLLVKDFHIVFESIIDELVGDKTVAKPLKENKDGKIIDHIFPYSSIIDESQPIYYIGDSKYYKLGHEVQEYSEYKQYTYAKNVIQYNLDLFFKGRKGALKYRDEITEGYNVTPNFFISAVLEEDRNYNKNGLHHREESDKFSRHFENRLFDRDTLWLAHYDINFLFVISLYALSNEHAKSEFREFAREEFRNVTIKRIKEKYTFYVLKVRSGCKFQDVIDSNFRRLNGKIFCPDSTGSYFYLALSNEERFEEENYNVLKSLGNNFICSKYSLGSNPYLTIMEPKKYLAEEEIAYSPYFSIAADNEGVYVNHLRFEDNLSSRFMFGCCKSTDHKNWIFKGGEKAVQYNIREGNDRHGAIVADDRFRIPNFLVLYNCFNELDYSIFEVVGKEVKTQEEMEGLEYPNPSGSYIVFTLGRMVLFEDIDMKKILSSKRKEKNYFEGAPFFLLGEHIKNLGGIKL